MNAERGTRNAECESGANSEFRVCLSIAGSDSGGGAGIQADLKTFAALNIHGTSAITCVTAQNPDGVYGVAAVEPDIVALQIQAVCDGFPVAAAKTGMLYSAPIIRAVATALETHGIGALVVDPVMVATSGAKLLQDDAIDAMCSDLIPRAVVVTPNIPEAQVLGGGTVTSLQEQRAIAEAIAHKFDVACVVKGGHGDYGIVDVLYADGEVTEFTGPVVSAVETHGTGCTYSAAVAAFLARGESLADAAGHAKQFVTSALEHAVSAGRHAPLMIR